MKLLALLLFANIVQASDLDRAIDHASRAHGVSAARLKAIAQLESSGGRNVKLRHNKNGTYDIGPFQINSIHWSTTCRAYDLSTTQGNADCAALLLRKARRHAGTDPHWVGRYHSKTPSRKINYANKIKVFLDRADKKL